MSYLDVRPECKMLMYLTCIYQHDKRRQRRIALRMLYAHPAVSQLRVFTGQEWQKVSARCGVDFTHSDSFRSYFDNYWQKELHHILTNKEIDEECWENFQKSPRLQYLTDGGDPSLIFNNYYCSQQSRDTKLISRNNNKSATATAIAIILLLIFFFAAILSGWISTEGSAEQLQNITLIT
ncbi:hypothetical protein L9F63_023768 [Diploptera punctata]|uniref:Uncharacterized protein n=1 Tax=Diploptera punctata TaxID=6984 RepID=A0AAD7ZIA9_DIPPU|nr:hypothetical protein L9F63_023768 [Diploptera punctata]